MGRDSKEPDVKAALAALQSSANFMHRLLIKRIPMKDLRPEDLLLQGVLMFEKSLFNAVAQEAAELRRLLENLAA